MAKLSNIEDFENKKVHEEIIERLQEHPNATVLAPWIILYEKNGSIQVLRCGDTGIRCIFQDNV